MISAVVINDEEEETLFDCCEFWSLKLYCAVVFYNCSLCRELRLLEWYIILQTALRTRVREDAAARLVWNFERMTMKKICSLILSLKVYCAVGFCWIVDNPGTYGAWMDIILQTALRTSVKEDAARLVWIVRGRWWRRYAPWSLVLKL